MILRYRGWFFEIRKTKPCVMKKLIIIASLLALVLGGCAKKKFKIPETDVPTEVVSNTEE
jgi:hypothetical protein